MRRPSFNEKDVSDKQHVIRKLSRIGKRNVIDHVRGRAGALASVDDAVANLVRRLAADGELNNTYLAFITDNGHQLGEHRHFSKTLGFEESVRTPLLVRGPGCRCCVAGSGRAQRPVPGGDRSDRVALPRDPHQPVHLHEVPRRFRRVVRPAAGPDA